MANESIAYLKGKVDNMADALQRLNTALVAEWQAYRRYFRADELARARHRLAAPDPDDTPQACYALC